MPEDLLVGSSASTAPTTEGYTLSQMVQRVRQVLRPLVNTMDESSTGPQGYTLADMRQRVRNVLRDAVGVNPPFVTDAEINQYLNEGLVDIAARTRSVRHDLSGTTDAQGRIAIPADFSDLLRVEIRSQPADLVNSDEQWYDWFDSNQPPPRILMRIFQGYIETYPQQVQAAYDIRYAARPTDLVNDTDLSQVPIQFQLHAIQYARAQAKLKENELLASEQYMSQYEHGIAPLTEQSRAGEDVLRGRTPQQTTTVITDYEIIDLLNEGLLDLAARTRMIRRIVPGSTDGTATVVLPIDFLKMDQFTILNAQTSPALPSPGSDVQFVDDSTFQSWKVPGLVPSNTIGRYTTAFTIELYPIPAKGFTFNYTYVARPATLVKGSDKSELPVELQIRAIRYAQALCKVKEGDAGAAQFYMASFNDHLAPANPQQRRIPGPNQLIPMPGPFDTIESKAI